MKNYGKITEFHDQGFNEIGIDWTRNRIQGHSPAAEADAIFVEHVKIWILRSRGISPVDDFSDEIGEVERIADEGHPAKEVGEAQDPQRLWHVDDGP